jgi:hypothetical protein
MIFKAHAAFFLFISLFILTSCIPVQGTIRVAEPLDVIVMDAETKEPIPSASVVYIVCDLHDYGCSRGKLIRAASNEKGEINIEGETKTGTWVLAPGAMPVPSHLIAIWAPGYSAFVFIQYKSADVPIDELLEIKKKSITRTDILKALHEIPEDKASSNERLNSKKELIGGKIRLLKIRK